MSSPRLPRRIRCPDGRIRSSSKAGAEVTCSFMTGHGTQLPPCSSVLPRRYRERRAGRQESSLLPQEPVLRGWVGHLRVSRPFNETAYGSCPPSRRRCLRLGYLQRRAGASLVSGPHDTVPAPHRSNKPGMSGFCTISSPSSGPSHSTVSPSSAGAARRIGELVRPPLS